MSCRPPTNSTYLAIGQDLFSIDEYVKSQYNYSLHHPSNIDWGNNGTLNSISNFVPSGELIEDSARLYYLRRSSPNNDKNPRPLSAFMVYTDLATLKGLWEPSDYGSGVEYADGIVDLFPSSSSSSSRSDNRLGGGGGIGIGRSPAGLQIGLWLDGAGGCFSICAGEMDDRIRLLASYLERSRAPRIFLRLGYEFDNPSFGYSENPDVYVLAFRKIVSDCRNILTEGARERVLFVWHSWAAPMADGLSLESFYPGDDVVDWVGVSIFQQVYPWSPYWAGTVKDVDDVLIFARDHGKVHFLHVHSLFTR